MPSQRRSKVIVDAHLWISFLIEKELKKLKDLIPDEKVRLVTTSQLINEIKLVTSRPKLQKYFDPKKVADLISFLDIVSEKVPIERIEPFCRDPKEISYWRYAK